MHVCTVCMQLCVYMYVCMYVCMYTIYTDFSVVKTFRLCIYVLTYAHDMYGIYHTITSQGNGPLRSYGERIY